MNSKVAITIPTNRGIKPQTAESLLRMVESTKHETHSIVATEGYTIAENRTYLTFKAINNNCTHQLFVDDDMVLPLDTLDRLLNHEKDIIGVPYYSRMLPRKPVWVQEDGEAVEGELPKELFKCAHVGTGIMLINLEVFNNIEKPWFLFQTHPQGKVVCGEDKWFCQQARKVGYDVWCDPTLKIGHVGDYIY